MISDGVVRAEYEKIGILEFEELKDSTVEPEPPPALEVMELMARLQQQASQAS